MTPSIAYTSSDHVLHLENHAYTVRDLTPKLSDRQRDEVKKQIESVLYGIFRKYMA